MPLLFFILLGIFSSCSENKRAEPSCDKEVTVTPFKLQDTKTGHCSLEE